MWGLNFRWGRIFQQKWFRIWNPCKDFPRWANAISFFSVGKSYNCNEVMVPLNKNRRGFYLVRRPDGVGLHITPAGHFQTRRVLAVILGNYDRIVNNLTVLLAEVVLAEPNLDGGGSAAHFGGEHLTTGPWWSWNRQ